MKLVIQRVTQAKVEVENQLVGSIGPGLLILLGVTLQDTEEQSQWLANKVVNLRIFEDNQGKFNCSLLETHGQALIVSQFTLYGDCSTGRRPSFTEAAPPELAEKLYLQFVDEVRKLGVPVETGRFGAKMAVSLQNDGPVTLLLERNRNPC